MNFYSDYRDAHSVPSDHHQTILSKAITEHFDSFAAIASVAASSKSIQNSSLPANLLYNFCISEGALQLLDVVFHPTVALPIQFAPGIELEFPDPSDKKAFKHLSSFFSALVQSKYFAKSVRTLKLVCPKTDSLPSWLGGKVFSGVQTLDLSAVILGKEDAEVINRSFPNAKAIKIRGVQELANTDLEALSLIKDITQLDFFDGLHLKDDAIRFLVANKPDDSDDDLLLKHHITTTLTSLELSICVKLTDASMPFVAELSGLRELNLENSDKITDEGIAHLMKLENLTILNIAYLEKLTDESLKSIASSSFAATLKEFYLMNAGQRSFTDEGVKELAHLKNLTKLNARTAFARVSGTVIASVISCMPNLTFVNLARAAKLEDDDVGVIATSCLNLTGIDLSYLTNLGDASLGHMSRQLKHLMYLSMSKVDKVTDVGVGQLCSGCLKLQTVEFPSCNKITDVSLETHFSKLTNLINLDIGYCGHTEAAEEELRKMMKNR